MPYANNKGTGQPAHPRSLISTFVVRYLDSIRPTLDKLKIQDSVAEQACLSLTVSQIPKDKFSSDKLKCSLSVFRTVMLL